MNNAENHIDSWSMTDVQQYLNGELSARERHALEKLALDDPFLADALEGLQTQPDTTREQDLGKLRARLDTRTATTTRIVAFPRLRIAAAIIALIGIGFTAYYTLFRTKPSAEVAHVAAPRANTPSAAPKPAMDSSAVAINEKSALDQKAAAEKNPAIEKRSAVPQKRTAKQSHVAQNLADTAIAKQNTADVAAVPSPAATYAPEKTAVRRALFGDSLPANLLAFSGRVLDQNDHPLAGASLKYNNNAAATFTDNTGRFNLYLPKQDTARQLTVAMIGYENAEYALNTENRTGNVIFLKQEPGRLDEVVVTGVGSKRREVYAEQPSDIPEKLDSLWLITAPAMGRINYLNYLDTAKKRLPVDPAIHGIESISFSVDRKGTLTGFKIERSLSPAHDAGVIHLITDGPPWKMVHGRQARALVNVKFP